MSDRNTFIGEYRNFVDRGLFSCSGGGEDALSELWFLCIRQLGDSNRFFFSLIERIIRTQERWPGEKN